MLSCGPVSDAFKARGQRGGPRNARARSRSAVWGGAGAGLALPVATTLVWNGRCRGADELCALAFLVWLIRSLFCGPLLGATVAALLAPAGDRSRAAGITVAVSGGLLWGMLVWGHWAWGWPLVM